MILKFAAQLFFVVAVSIGSFALLGGKPYLLIGGAIALITLALLLGRGNWAVEDADRVVLEDAEPFAFGMFMLDAFYRFVLSVLLGAFWPSLPFIVWRGGARDRANRGRQPTR